MSAAHVTEIEVDVVVANGIGHKDFQATGEIADVYIVPSDGGTYDWEIVSASGATRAGETGVTGTRLVDAGRRPCQKKNTLNVSNAASGTYKFIINIVRGFSSGL